MAKLSIIIPCYNNGNYLKKMLDCFLKQTVDYWEVIIVDDHSTDDTPEFIRKYENKDKRIHFFVRDRDPKGSVVCRNIGFTHSTGKYVCHLDADDLVSNTFVEHRVQFMELNPDLDYASFCAKTFSDEDNLPKFDTKVKTYGVKNHSSDLLEDFLSTDYSLSVWNNIYRRSSIENLPWDENVKIYTDFSFIVPGILAGLKHSFAGIKEVDYYYRTFLNKKGSINMCGNYVTQDKCESTLYLFHKILEGLDGRTDCELRKEQFLRFVVLHYERLLNGGNYEDAEKYIEMIGHYYAINISNSMKSIIKHVENINKPKIFNIILNWNLYRKFGYKIYWVQFTHSVGKLILCR